MILVLVKHHIITSNGYTVTPQQHDMILDGSMHLAELFNNNLFSNNFCLDDLEDIEIRSLSITDNHKTNKPTIYHGLNCSVIHDILTWTDTASPSVILMMT